METWMHLLSKNKVTVWLNEDDSLLCSTNDNNDKAYVNQSQTCNWLHVNTFESRCWLLAHVSHSEHFVRMQILNCWAVHTHETSTGTQWDTACRWPFCRILNLPLWKESQKPYTQATTFCVWKKQTLWETEKQELVILSRKQIVINTCISTQKHFILHVLEKAWQIWTLVRHKLKKLRDLSVISHTYTNTHNVLKTLYFTFAYLRLLKIDTESPL